MLVPIGRDKRWRGDRTGGYRRHMVLQLTLPWPATIAPCPKCHGKGDVYYLHARSPAVDVAGGKPVACPVCANEGRIGVQPLRHRGMMVDGAFATSIEADLARTEDANSQATVS